MDLCQLSAPCPLLGDAAKPGRHVVLPISRLAPAAQAFSGRLQTQRLRAHGLERISSDFFGEKSPGFFEWKCEQWYRIYMWFIWDFYDLYGMSMITWDFTKKLELKLNLLYIFVWFHWNRGRGIKIEFLWGLTKIWDLLAMSLQMGWCLVEWDGLWHWVYFTMAPLLNHQIWWFHGIFIAVFDGCKLTNYDESNPPGTMVDARDETRLEG